MIDNLHRLLDEGAQRMGRLNSNPGLTDYKPVALGNFASKQITSTAMTSASEIQNDLYNLFIYFYISI